MRTKAKRVLCPECGQQVLTYMRDGVEKRKGHCRPGTDPKKSIGCDCRGSYTVVERDCPECGAFAKRCHTDGDDGVTRCAVTGVEARC